MCVRCVNGYRGFLVRKKGRFRVKEIVEKNGCVACEVSVGCRVDCVY